MVTVLLIAVGLLALLVAVLFAALVEMFRDLRQIRDALGILDRPLTVDTSPVAGTRPGSYGLPRALDSASAAVVLFLSDRCNTCHVLAGGLLRPLAAELCIVLYARTGEDARAFVERYQLQDAVDSGQVIVDVEGAIGSRIGLETTPVAFRVENGVLTSAMTVPSTRFLTSLLPQPIRLRKVG